MSGLALPSIEPDILVSVGIPTFNRAALLDKRIANVVAQTYQNLEIIVSDNASPDAAVEEVCHRWASSDVRIRLFRQPVNIGAYNNFLFVMDQAKGRYFVWAADDDEWDENYVGEALRNIGSSQLYMSRAGVRYILTGEEYSIALPGLTSAHSHYANAKQYLANAQPTLLYGLHELDALKQIIPRSTFDLSDVLIVYRAILGKGVAAGGISEYRAGIPDEIYKIKPVGMLGSPDKISYRKAAVGCLAATFSSSNLPIGQRFVLSFFVVRLMIKTANHLTLTYPHVARPHHFVLSQTLTWVSRVKDVLRPLKFWRRR